MQKFDTLLICDHVLLGRSAEAESSSLEGESSRQTNPQKPGGLSAVSDKAASFNQKSDRGGFRFVTVKDHAVGVRQGRIAFVGPVSKDLKAEKTLRFKNHLLSPGLINTHTHLPMSLFRGLADDLPLKEWLENYIFPLEGRFVNEDFIAAGARLAALELIKTGVTSFCDMYFYNRTLAEVMDKAGLRGFIGVAVPSVEKDWRNWRQKALELKEVYKNNPRIHPAIAPHAPYTAGPDILKAVGEFSKEENMLLTIHVSESLWEQRHIQEKYNTTPVKLLHNLGVTGPNALFAHCVHVSPDDLQIMAETGTSLSYNPESNMKLSSGAAPVGAALKAGVTVGLGTDGAASNNNLNFFGEISSGVRLQSLQGENSITAQDMFQTATLGGARALGLEKEIGSIETGKQADMIAIDLNHPQFYPPYNLVSHLVYSAQGGEVDFVMCNGRILMENRQVQTLNEEDIYQESRDFGRKIQEFLHSS